jgi:hypothetical protein
MSHLLNYVIFASLVSAMQHILPPEIHGVESTLKIRPADFLESEGDVMMPHHPPSHRPDQPYVFFSNTFF